MRRRPDWLHRSWWTADRVSRASLVSVLLSMTLRMGRDDHPAGPAAAWVVFAISVLLAVLATAMYLWERRRGPAAADSPADAGRGGGR